MKKKRFRVDVFLLNLIISTVFHARSYLKMSIGSAFYNFLWDCLLVSFIAAVLFPIILNLAIPRTDEKISVNNS